MPSAFVCLRRWACTGLEPFPRTLSRREVAAMRLLAWLLFAVGAGGTYATIDTGLAGDRVADVVSLALAAAISLSMATLLRVAARKFGVTGSAAAADARQRRSHTP